jgi:hypothetical protein
MPVKHLHPVGELAHWEFQENEVTIKVCMASVSTSMLYLSKAMVAHYSLTSMFWLWDLFSLPKGFVR